MTPQALAANAAARGKPARFKAISQAQKSGKKNNDPGLPPTILKS